MMSTTTIIILVVLLVVFIGLFTFSILMEILRKPELKVIDEETKKS